MDLSKVGTYTATITITDLPAPKEGAKVIFIGVEGQDKKFKAFASQAAKFAVPLTVGATAEAEIEVIADNYNGETRLDPFIRSFGGKVAKSGGSFGGGGGGRACQPKTKEEIHSASICGILKSCIEHGKDQDEAKAWLTLYAQTMKGLGGGA